MRGVSLLFWGLSLLFHLIILLLVLVFWPVNRQPPPSVSLHLESGPAPSGGVLVRGKAPRPTPPRAPRVLSPKPVAQAHWNSLRGELQARSSVAEKLPSPSFPDQEASAEDLLGEIASTQPASAKVWTSGGGSTPPLLPPVPPQNIPEGEITWHLTLWIPAQGGSPSRILGLETAHPHLDGWLGAWLARQGFPASENGKSYQVHWVLKLKSVSPD
ncbi:MAG: hypothetical protein HKM05_11880 [Spirochaetales bacterium]|nr:hypothetical protein [Spirochaetales bacterium]